MDKFRGTTVPSWLKVFGWLIMVGGFIAGIVVGSEEFSVAIMFVYWVASIVCGVLFLGVSEIIEQLQDIAYRISNLREKEVEPVKHYGLK